MREDCSSRGFGFRRPCTPSFRRGSCAVRCRPRLLQCLRLLREAASMAKPVHVEMLVSADPFASCLENCFVWFFRVFTCLFTSLSLPQTWGSRYCDPANQTAWRCGACESAEKKAELMLRSGYGVGKRACTPGLQFQVLDSDRDTVSRRVAAFSPTRAKEAQRERNRLLRAR